MGAGTRRMLSRPLVEPVRVGTRRYRPALMYGRVLGVAVLGVGGHLVTVEAHVGRGLPALIVTGLPGA
jgi:hypothetical protein